MSEKVGLLYLGPAIMKLSPLWTICEQARKTTSTASRRTDVVTHFPVLSRSAREHWPRGHASIAADLEHTQSQ